MLIVSKFGGTSMASAHSIGQVSTILERDSRRRICVVSAPGKSGAHQKVTDLLLTKEVSRCLDRIHCLADDLGLPNHIHMHAAEKLSELQHSGNEDALMSYGEYMSAYLLAAVTGREFVDARDIISFENNQVVVRISWDINKKVVIPGFYGSTVLTKDIRTFPRGGSDISASYIAQAVHAQLCENWTDVSGVFNKDPRLHACARSYDRLTYAQLAAIAQGGAQVFHEDAIRPLMHAAIPLVIKNTFAPEEVGTYIS